MLLKRRKSATGARSIASHVKVICGFNAKDSKKSKEKGRSKSKKEKDQKDKDQEEKGKEKANKDTKADIKTESAHVSLKVQQQASTRQLDASIYVALITMSAHHKYENGWIFDTTVSSHITSDLGRFETFSAYSGTIEVAGKTFLEYKGKGSCLVYPLYPDGTTSVVRLTNVFIYLP